MTSYDVASICQPLANGGDRHSIEPLKSFILLGNALSENQSVQFVRTHKLDIPVGTDEYCSPHHRLSFKSRNEASTCL